MAMRSVCADAPTASGATPFIAIVVPTLNEEAYIEACLASLVGQWPEHAYELLVMDGGSTDRTLDIVAAFAERHNTVALLKNPGRLQSAAMNLAAQVASPRAAVLLRADAHALYPPDFVQTCVAALLTSGATSVVVPMRTRAQPGDALQNAIAAAQSSRMGNGGAAHRVGSVSGFVDHGHHAAFDRRFFCALGGYDETFTHNEDAELDVRAVAAGGRVWMCAEAPVEYYPRNRLRSLARQYFYHGAGRAKTLRKHHLTPRPRQVAPVAALIGCVAGLAVAPIVPSLALVALVYPTACVTWGLSQVVQRRDPSLILGGIALMTMHLAWAVGFLTGFARGRPGVARPLNTVPLQPFGQVYSVPGLDQG